MRLRTFFRLAISGTLLATGGCGAADLPAELRVVATVEGLSLVNETERPVFYIAYEKRIEPLIDWFPCADPVRCDPVLPSERRTIAWSSVIGDRASPATYVVTWWQSETAPDGSLHAANTHSVLIAK